VLVVAAGGGEAQDGGARDGEAQDGEAQDGGARDGGAREGGPEAAARSARYRELDLAARRLGARAVLLGHTRDDQAETVLLGLLRGSGARSLAGMRPVRGVYRRPFLDLPAALTRQACAAQGLEPWQDPANADPAYARSRLRAVLARVTPDLDLALGGDLSAALARTAAQLAEDADALEGFAADLLDEARLGGDEARLGGDEARLGGGETELVLDAERLAKAPDAVRRRALLLAARRAGSPPGALGRRHVLAVDALVTRWRGQGPISLPGGVEVRRACGRLLLVPRLGPALGPPAGRDERRGDGSDDRSFGGVGE
jgi:tRNA(Ile)-lysidine synthase